MQDAETRDRVLAAILSWYRDMGVDVATAAEPV